MVKPTSSTHGKKKTDVVGQKPCHDKTCHLRKNQDAPIVEEGKTIVYTGENEEDFDDIIAGSKTIVRFTAEWCKPCKKIEPYYNKLAEENKEIKFMSVDVDQHDSIAAKCQAFKIPYFVLFKDGQQVDTLSGNDEDKLKNFINR